MERIGRRAGLQPAGERKRFTPTGGNSGKQEAPPLRYASREGNRRDAARLDEAKNGPSNAYPGRLDSSLRTTSWCLRGVPHAKVATEAIAGENPAHVEVAPAGVAKHADLEIPAA